MATRRKVESQPVDTGRDFTIEVEGVGRFTMRPMSARQFIRSLKGEWEEAEIIEALAERCTSHPFSGDFLDDIDILTAQALAAEWVRQHREAPIPPAHGGS